METKTQRGQLWLLLRLLLLGVAAGLQGQLSCSRGSADCSTPTTKMISHTSFPYPPSLHYCFSSLPASDLQFSLSLEAPGVRTSRSQSPKEEEERGNNKQQHGGAETLACGAPEMLRGCDLEGVQECGRSVAQSDARLFPEIRVSGREWWSWYSAPHHNGTCCGACEASEGAHGCDRRGEQDFEIHNGGWRSALQQLRRNDEVHFQSGTRHLRCLLGSAVRVCGRYGSSRACEGYGDQGFQGS